jgi:hypothetical protein
MIDGTMVKLEDVVVFKKPHPCGETKWLVKRIGVDWKLECTKCHRLIMIPRLEALKKIKSIEKRVQ